MEKIKWGIIGPGNIANNFADGLKGSYSGQLVSIASKVKIAGKILATNMIFILILDLILMKI